jgi:transketolase
VFVPAFDPDVAVVVETLLEFPHPAYLRLGVCELPRGFPPPRYAPWRRLIAGSASTMLVTGPIVGSIIDAVTSLDEAKRPTVWLVSELPLGDPPAEFLIDVRRTGHLIVVEEHVLQGGVGQALGYYLASSAEPIRQFTHRFARGYVSGRYGSQRFHRLECGLDAESIVALVRDNGRTASRLVC